MSCAVGHRLGSDLALLWLCCGLAAAALIAPLAWELPYAAGVAPKKKKEGRMEGREEGKKEKEGKRKKEGVPIVAQPKQIRLGTRRLGVQSLASLSGLRIRERR